MKNIIEDAGYPTVTAMDGLEGLDALHANSDKVKVILTDIEMPNMDGLEMSKKIRTDSVYDELPIIACTSVAGEMAEKRGFESGLDEYLIKLDREQVIEKVRHYMKNGRKKMAIG
ncbi:MAG: response regulator, partial [Candidatus Marinimicrobia bacterium]|nr:response regulator [Candidatus Neomarinimicrobiota bacterium]